jgi:uncharacterized membrane protein
MSSCVDCAAAPSAAPTIIISLVVTVCVGWLFVDALRARGHRWAATMIGGIIFGEIVEWLNTHDVPFIQGNHIYCYPDLPINWFGVPFWVPVGWGGIIYAATWTAQRLRLPPLLARPVAAAFLAASIDFSLDPVARLTGFWRWECFRVSFCGVPYDNFIGWYLIVFIYSATAAWLLRITKPRWDVQAERFSREWRWSVFIQWAAPLLCALVATVVLVAFKWALAFAHVTSDPSNDGSGAAKIFMVATTVGALVTLVLAGKPVADVDPPVNWPVIVVPAVMHVTCYALLLRFADWSQEPMLVAAIPIQLLAGLFVFATPWRRQLG